MHNITLKGKHLGAWFNIREVVLNGKEDTNINKDIEIIDQLFIEASEKEDN